jgi:hypothetical protein
MALASHRINSARQSEAWRFRRPAHRHRDRGDHDTAAGYQPADRCHAHPNLGCVVRHELSIIAVCNQGVHLPSMKVGCQRPRGQKRTEMMY